MVAVVRRLRTRRDRDQQAALRHLRALIDDLAAELPPDVLYRVGTFLDRKIASEAKWTFTMVNAPLYAEYVRYLREHSKRPLLALQLLAELIASLPDDSNTVEASREELADRVGCAPERISELISEMEVAGIVAREKVGRGVRYIVNPLLGTHLAGAARDKAQATAPALRVVEVQS
jgi:hypothetical protein